MNINSHYKKLMFVLLVVPTLIIVYLFLSIYLFMFKDTSQSYSMTQTWAKYYSVDNWNIPTHAIVDIDEDGQNDMITFTNCAFLSSITKDQIPKDRQCSETNMSPLVFQDNDEIVGQKLFGQKQSKTLLLHQSYLVKTQNNIWKFYDINGFQLRVYESGTNKLFYEIKPSLLDYTDTFTYQFAHLGIALFLIATHF